MTTQPALLLALMLGLASLASAEEDHHIDFDQVSWQDASSEDMAMFEPYLGTFRSETHTSDSGTPYYFTVRYEFYDRSRSVVRYTLETHLPEAGEVRELGEGYYFYDASSQRIGVLGVFKDGRTGAGYMTPFDASTGERTVRLRAHGSQGGPVEVRDTFRLIDEDAWENVTYVSQNHGPWQKMSEGIYTRVHSPEESADPVSGFTEEPDHRRTVERYYSHFQKPGFEVDELRKCYADDGRFVDPTFEITATGKEEVRRLYADIGTSRTHYRKIHWDLEKILVEGNDVSIHGRWSGEFHSCPFEIDFVTLWQLDDGLIIEQQDYFAASSFDRQVQWNPSRRRAECGVDADD